MGRYLYAKINGRVQELSLSTVDYLVETAETALASANSAVTTANTASSQAQTAITTAQTATTAANDTTAAANTVISSVGNVANLTTTAKGNIVAAVNEINTKKADASTVYTKTETDTLLANKLGKTENAVSATKLNTARNIALTGDVTGTAGFDGTANASIASTLAASGVTAGSYGPSADASPAHTGTFSVPYLTVDAKGRVTAASTKTITLPADNNSDTKVTQTVSTANNNYPLLATATANATATATTTSIFASAVKLNPATGSITATQFNGNLTGNVTGNAATATKLATARSLNVQDASATNTGTAASFDGSGNATIKLPATIKATLSGNASTATNATTLSTARTIDGVSFNGSANITHYGTCSTAAATAAKTVACTGFTLVTGAKIDVKFTVTNTAANPTLNVNSTGAKAIYCNGAAIGAVALSANGVYSFVYDGTYYQLVSANSPNIRSNEVTVGNASITIGTTSGSFIIPRITVDKQGRVSAVSASTIKLSINSYSNYSDYGNVSTS